MRPSLRPLAWLALGLSLVLLGCGPKETPAPEFRSPPVLVVDIDTLRADHLGCYGYHRDTSPNLDDFAEEAARFVWAYSQGPNTPPSQASILTGLYPTSHGRILDRQKVAPEVTTIAEVLKDAGYRTAALVDGGLMAAGFGLEQGFDLYDDEAGGLRDIGPKTFDWLDDHLSSDDPDQPFFLLVHTYDVHSPYEVTPSPWRDYFLQELDELPSEEYRSNMSKHMRETWDARHDEPPPQLDDAELAYAKAMYDGGIRHVDDWFGRLIEWLEERRVLDELILVVISDHGDEFQEHDTLFHERIYGTVTRIPFLIRFPEGEGRGVYDAVVQGIDLAPTLFESLELEPPEGLQGMSLLPLLDGASGRRRVAISESPFLGRRLALTTEDSRYFLTVQGGETELYAYREDPLEQQDLSAEQPEKLRELRRLVRRWQQAVRQQRYRGGEAVDLDPETIEQLRALGYID